MTEKAFCCVGSSCMSLKGSQRRFKWCSYMYQNWIGLKASHTIAAGLRVQFHLPLWCQEWDFHRHHTPTHWHTPTTSNSVFAANSAAKHEECSHVIAQKAVLVFLKEITQTCQKKERSRPRFPCFIYFCGKGLTSTIQGDRTGQLELLILTL